jgi:4-hydroxy-2-oxoglutarate aldolase
MNITGVIPPMITPFKENGDVDFDAFSFNIEKWNKDDLGGYLVLGSNSEAAYLSYDERLRLIELTVQTARKDRVVLAGTGLESSRETIRLTNDAAKRGVHAALVLTPSYYGDAMTDEALIRFFTEVAGKSDIPILIYNVPKFTHINISATALRELSRQPNIIGIKDSKADVIQLAEFSKVIPKDFNLMVGNVVAWLPALELGIKAGIHATANCAPNQCSAIQKYFEAGETAKAKQMQERVNPLNKAVTATYGIAGLKYSATLMGYKGGFVRSPLLPLKDSAKEEIRAILTVSRFIQGQ